MRLLLILLTILTVSASRQNTQWYSFKAFVMGTGEVRQGETIRVILSLASDVPITTTVTLESAVPASVKLVRQSANQDYFVVDQHPLLITLDYLILNTAQPKAILPFRYTVNDTYQDGFYVTVQPAFCMRYLPLIRT